MGPKAKRHFKPIDGRMRFYANGHGYFVVGEKIRYPGVYEGVEIGAVADAHYASKHDKRVPYRTRFRLPKDHPDAHDENGRRQVRKYGTIWDVELMRLNPEEC
jgi:hypothetical protein